MTTKYTPGPWQLEVIDDHEIEISHSRCTYPIATTDQNNPRASNDAHLIAAAPELLEALEHLAEYYKGSTSPHMTMILKAIAKAKGTK